MRKKRGEIDMSDETFYQDHWREIEAERLARYEVMFVFRPQHEALLQPLQLESGLQVVDYGCGPGFLAMELARRVGEKGRVFGFDINADFVARASARTKDANLTQLEFSQLSGAAMPLPDNSVDRLICKNVFEYVPDCVQTLAEQRRVLKPGGIIEIIDSDWGFVLVEPWGKSRTDAFFEAARGAFNEFYIGRKLKGLLSAAGFQGVEVRISASADTTGGGLNVITNMASYAQKFNTMSDEHLSMMIAELRDAIEVGNYLFVLPQFIVTGVK